ncbi:MAG TPA: ABC transporter permease [Planctomycetota bacterium]
MNEQTEQVETQKTPAPPSTSAALMLLSRLQSGIGLILIIILAIVLSPRARDGSIIFLESGNLTDILKQVSETGIMALGMTFVILTAGIDLSVGSILALSATVTALCLDKSHYGAWFSSSCGSFGVHIAAAAAMGILAGAAVGTLNGLVISRLKIQPFIVTLATMLGIRGLARLLVSNTNIDFGFGNDVTAVFCDVVSHKAFVIGSLLTVAIVLAVLLNRTVFGRYVRAIGDNERAALYTGIPIGRMKVWVYVLAGLLTGLAGVIHAAQSHQGNANDGVSYELDAIAAVVIGGTRLSGGSGTIVGTMIGTLIMGILVNLLGLNGMDENRKLIIKAVIIILAVWVQSGGRTALLKLLRMCGLVRA